MVRMSQCENVAIQGKSGGQVRVNCERARFAIFNLASLSRLFTDEFEGYRELNDESLLS